MNVKITLDSCTNEALFGLTGATSAELSPAVLQFLKSRTYPWELLGNALKTFVAERVAAVPAAERLKGNISPSAFLENRDSIVIESGAVVEAGAYISGPAYIESGATVRHGAYIRGQVYVCRGAVVGHVSEVKGSLLLNDAKAAHFAYVGDSILGVNSNLGAGTKCANLRLDHGEVKVPVGETSVPSGLKKFGAVFGNGAQSGCNSVTNPGAILSCGAIIMPNSTATGYVAARRALRPPTR